MKSLIIGVTLLFLTLFGWYYLLKFFITIWMEVLKEIHRVSDNFWYFVVILVMFIITIISTILIVGNSFLCYQYYKNFIQDVENEVKDE